MKSLQFLTSFLIAILLITANSTPQQLSAQDSAQDKKDERMIEILLRLKKFDIGSNPKYADAILRYLDKIKGSERYLELIETFKLSSNDTIVSELSKLIKEKPESSVGVNAARLLLEADKSELLKKLIASDEESIALAAVQAIGAVGSDKSMALIRPLITSDTVSATIRNYAVRSVGKNRRGQSYLLELVKDKKMPKDLSFSFTNVLNSSRFEDIAKEAANYLSLPETADSTPLPAVAELVSMKGDLDVGKKVFATTGTCAKCHKVRGEGTDIGPDLTEIGSKLSREAMFVSILNPSEGISHNYESYFVELDSGLSDTGLLVSKTDDEITLKNAEGVLRKIAMEEVIEFEKEKKSLMPDGLQKSLTVQELVSLVDYMQTLTKQE